MSIIYPKIPHDKNKSVKIKLADQVKMKLLIDEGWSIKYIAELYHVSQTCVQYNTDPIFRKKELDIIKGIKEKYVK